MVQTAFIIAFVYWLVKYTDDYLLAWQCLGRPVVISPIIGLVLGDLRSGLVMGAALESIFMGMSYIGGTTPADASLASVVSVAFTILSNSSIETGMAIALPIGTLMASIDGAMQPIYSTMVPYWEKQAVKGNIKSFMIQNIIFTALTIQMVPCIILFIAVAYGIDGLNAVFAALPAWVMTGLEAATGMMIAVGFAILTSMIWSGEVAGFFFVGYILCKFLHLDTLPIAILAATVAVTMFISERRISELKNSLSGGKKKKDEEDFF